MVAPAGMGERSKRSSAKAASGVSIVLNDTWSGSSPPKLVFVFEPLLMVASPLAGSSAVYCGAAAAGTGRGAACTSARARSCTVPAKATAATTASNASGATNRCALMTPPPCRNQRTTGKNKRLAELNVTTAGSVAAPSKVT